MRKDYARFGLLVFLAILLDQLSKIAIVKLVRLGDSIPVWGDFFRITYILNPGGAFGTRLGGEIFYLSVSLLAIIFTVAFFVKTDPRHILIRSALALVLGGAVGNLIDRFRLGEVIDFLDFNVPDISLLGYRLDRWPIFNLADATITVGAVLLIWHIVRQGFVKANPPLAE